MFWSDPNSLLLIESERLRVDRDRLLLLLGGTVPTLGQGVVLSSAGPINRSMGGAAVAAPLDVMGSLYWNPATLAATAASRP